MRISSLPPMVAAYAPAVTRQTVVQTASYANSQPDKPVAPVQGVAATVSARRTTRSVLDIRV